MSKNIIVVGAGLVGSALAAMLAKRGDSVTVYERRPDMRKAQYVGGRSINLALSARGWATLDLLGLRDKVAPLALPMTGRMVHNLDGSQVYIPYGKEGQAIYSISRGQLNQVLVNEAALSPSVAFHFEQRCDHIDFEHNQVTFMHTATGEQQRVAADYIIGSDGAFSQIRYEMQKTPQFNFSQQYEAYGYKELTIPAGANGSWQIDKTCLHIWPRQSFMMIALPNLDGSFTCTIFAPYSGAEGFDAIKTKSDIEQYFAAHFASALPLMPQLSEEYYSNPVGSLVTTRCYPWVHGATALIGDSAHAIVPFYGQGMNAGFEDVRVLHELLHSTGSDWHTALDQYQISRKPNADAIADLALYNFIEMRDLSGQAGFQLRLRLEKHLAAKFPTQFNTLYSMVTFDQVPYAQAQAQANKQAALLDQLMAMPEIESKWDGEEVLGVAREWLAA